jgi:hypothetical protein
MYTPLLFGGFVAVQIVATPAAADQPEPVPGFRFCSPPPAPACVGKDAAYRDENQTKACQDEVGRYVNSAFAYRACLQREIQRAVLETNMTIDRFKCGIASKHRCSDEELRKRKNPRIKP